jgi:hypothetical protein
MEKIYITDTAQNEGDKSSLILNQSEVISQNQDLKSNKTKKDTIKSN